MKAKIELIHKDNADVRFVLVENMEWASEEDLFGFISQLKKDFKSSLYEVVVTL